MRDVQPLVESAALGVLKKYTLRRKAKDTSDTLLDELIDEKMKEFGFLGKDERAELRRCVKIRAFRSM